MLQEPLVSLDYDVNRIEDEKDALHLLESNRLLNKVLLTLTKLCQEIDSHSKESQRMQMHFLYLDEELATIANQSKNSANDNIKIDNKDKDSRLPVWKKISESLQSIYHIQFLLQRASALGSNLFCQLGALLTKSTHEAGLSVNIVV